MTTTGLRPRSPYPRGTAEFSCVHRYAHTFDPREFVKLQMARTTRETEDAQRNAVKRVTQVHFLLLRKDSARERAVANHIKRRYPERKNHQWSACFPGGSANDYAEYSPAFGGKLVVNVMFWHAVDAIEYDGPGVKTGKVFTPPVVQEPSDSWFRSFLESHPDEDAHFQNQKAAELRRKLARMSREEGAVRRREFRRQRKARKAGKGALGE